jgi:peptide/nickel transport system substrate-binding protein
MRHILKYFAVFMIIILSIVLVCCSSGSTTPPSSTTPATVQTTMKTTSTQSSPIASTSSSSTGNWWDKLGQPKYGGSINVRTNTLAWTSFDPAVAMGMQVYQWEYESLFVNDWTVDRNTWSFKLGFVPLEYTTGLLAQSWEQDSPTTVKITLRQGIHWQNKPPVNGRELTAEDVQYSYDRFLGTGNGFTEKNFIANMIIPSVEKVVATDKYTLEVYFNGASATNLLQLSSLPLVATREWVERGDLQNWKNAVGTGPWMVSDYTPGVSITFSKYADYWGHDERYPQNKVPYLDELKVTEIQDDATALAAFRSSRIDMSTLSIQQSLQLVKTNPDAAIEHWPGPAYNIDMRCDNKPFTDIRVRIAMQMAIDGDSITKNLYSGIPDGTPCGLMSPLMKGWAFDYSQWSDKLKQEYSYSPEKAKALLAEAGYPQGFDTNIVVSSAQNSELIQAIKAYLSAINVNADIKVLDATAFEAFQDERKHDQMTIETKAGGPGGPDLQYTLRWSKGPHNFTMNHDTDYDNLYENQYVVAATMDDAKQACIAMDKYALEQHWSVSIYQTTDPVASQPWVKGFSGELMILGSGPGTNYARWWIDKGSK